MRRAGPLLAALVAAGAAADRDFHYLPYQQLQSKLQELHAAFPNHTRLIDCHREFGVDQLGGCGGSRRHRAVAPRLPRPTLPIVDPTLPRDFRRSLHLHRHCNQRPSLPRR